MPDHPPSKPARPWRVIAEQASRGFDSKKMAGLLLELTYKNKGSSHQAGQGQKKNLLIGSWPCLPVAPPS